MASVAKRKWTKPDGSTGEGWECRYHDAGGRRRGKTFQLKKEADLFKRKVEREIEDGTHVADADAATVADVAKRYLANAEQRARDGRLGRTRVKSMETFLRLHILPNIGARRMKDLQPGDVEALYRTLARGTLSPASAKFALQELRTMEGYAVRVGATKATPIATGIKDLRGIKAPPIRTLSQDDASRVLRHVLSPRFAIRKRSSSLIACAIHLAACCGLRSGEIRALTRDCLDLEIGEVRIRRNLTELFEVKGPKTAAGNRNVPLPRHLVAMLRTWLDEYARPNDLGLVFTTIHNAPIKGTLLRQMWATILQETGIGGGHSIHFHALRHFAASWWIENGLSLPETATMLGHSKVDMTLSVYAHALVRPQVRAAAMQRMAERITDGTLNADAPETHGALAH